MLERTRRRVAIGATVVASTFGVAAVAQAASLVYFDGTTSGTSGPRHSLTETSVRLNGGRIACTWALESNGSIAGTSACVTSVGSAVAHSYNGTLRQGACGTPQGYGASSMRCREDW